MKKTLTLLAAVALALGASQRVDAKNLYVIIDHTDSPTYGDVLAPGATLINTETGNSFSYDVNVDPPVDPPFDYSEGSILKGFTLQTAKFEDVVIDDVTLSEGDDLILDFSTYHTGGGSGLGLPTEKDYLVIMFNDSNFATWYEENPVSITGKFRDGELATAYVVSYACDMYDESGSSLNTASTYGGLVFFSRQTEGLAYAATVPEPTTATLSLLALAGLAARRRRK